MKFNFSTIQLLDIEGKPIPDSKVYKTIANIIWKFAKTLDLIEIARAINKGEEVELSESDVIEVQRLVRNPQSGIYAYAQKAILDYIKSVN